jgi:cyclophilin family peptidyl-prolyl cis-trans isomerase
MRSICVLFALLVSFVFGIGQEYHPRAGETVLRLDIEGRGNVYIKLHIKEAPKTCAHVLDLVRSRFYEGQRFHKVIKSPRPYLVQIGDPGSRVGDLDAVGSGGSGISVPYEDSGFANEAGAVGLASVKNAKDSGDSQFYMLLDNAAFLDKKYTIFGQVVEGMDVLKRVERGDRLLSVTILGG